MTTLIVKGKSAKAMRFLENARTLPFVEVEDKKQRRFKPEVEEALRKSERWEDVVICKDAEDMFKQLGLRK